MQLIEKAAQAGYEVSGMFTDNRPWDSLPRGLQEMFRKITSAVICSCCNYKCFRCDKPATYCIRESWVCKDHHPYHELIFDTVPPPYAPDLTVQIRQL